MTAVAMGRQLLMRLGQTVGESRADPEETSPATVQLAGRSLCMQRVHRRRCATADAWPG
jgi:hypothetical protein